MALVNPATRLQELRNAADRVSANLVDLEIDSGRRLLDGSALQGETAARWARASEQLTELWRRHGLLQDFLTRADGLRGRRHAEELSGLLNGPSIELASADVPIAERRLLGGVQEVERCSPDDLLAAMSASFDAVKTVIAQIGDAWDAQIPKLEQARSLLAEARRLADRLGDGASAELAPSAERLEAVAASVTSDPLSATEGDVDELISALESARDEMAAAINLKHGFERRLLEAREQVSRLETAIDDSAASRQEVLAKIAGASAAEAPTAAAAPAAELAALTDLAGRGAWREASRSLAAWSARVTELTAAAERASAANRAPIQARNQLRSLLEAYRAKAQRLGCLEDPRVAAVYREAQDALYEAPSDLAQAAQLVRSYQEALGASPEVRP